MTLYCGIYLRTNARGKGRGRQVEQSGKTTASRNKTLGIGTNRV
jgi:hypothetical protein